MINRAERYLLHLSLWAAAITGGLFWVMKYRLTNDDPFSAVNHPWQPHLLAAHVLVVPLLVFVLGWIAPGHIIGGLTEARPRVRRSGVVVTLLALPMVASGYLMQVVTSDTLRVWMADLHMVSGGLFAALFLAHAVTGLRRRNGANGRRADSGVPDGGGRNGRGGKAVDRGASRPIVNHPAGSSTAARGYTMEPESAIRRPADSSEWRQR